MSSKLREALEKFNAVDLSGLEFPLEGDSSTIYNSNKKGITIPYWRVADLLNEVKAAQDMAKSAISAPPRNCDVGTTDDQIDRMLAFCVRKGKCSRCEHHKIGTLFRQCTLRWANMPYEGGGAK